MGKCVTTGKETDNQVLMADKEFVLKLVYMCPEEYNKLLMAWRV